MRTMGKLHHVAAGLRDAFVARENDVRGSWALGILYALADPESNTVVLRLLDGQAVPASPDADALARKYGDHVRAALAKLALPLERMAAAEVRIAFDAAPPANLQRFGAVGDPYRLTVAFALRDGREAAFTRYGFCLPEPPYRFAKRACHGVAPGSEGGILR